MMAKAMQLIVDACVRYDKRAALEKMKVQRQKLVFDIKTRTAIYDHSLVLDQIEEDLGFINEGLDRLAEDATQAS